MSVLGERTLDWFEVKRYAMECRRCGQHLCDLTAADTLGSLVKIADNHICGYES